jgi:hypothetical protein
MAITLEADSLARDGRRALRRFDNQFCSSIGPTKAQNHRCQRSWAGDWQVAEAAPRGFRPPHNSHAPRKGYGKTAPDLLQPNRHPRCAMLAAMRDPNVIETELMQISAMADDVVKFERIVAWCASHPDEVPFALHQIMKHREKEPAPTAQSEPSADQS